MLELKAKLRDEKSKNNELRKQGYVPAILYGPKIKNISLMVKSKDINKVYEEAGESTLFKLIVDTKEKKQENMVLIHDMASDPVHDHIIHIDFYQPRLDKAIVATVPLEFVGVSEAISLLGGILIKNMHEVEIEALPQNLPRVIEVDVSALKTYEGVIHVKDLVLPADTKINAEAEEVIANVKAPLTEAQADELDKSAVAGVEEVKVESEEKRTVEGEAEGEIKSEEKTEE